MCTECLTEVFHCEPNDPVEEAVVVALYGLLDAVKALEESHGDECDCHACRDSLGLAYFAEMICSLRESELVPFPAMIERHGLRRVYERHLAEARAQEEAAAQPEACPPLVVPAGAARR